MSSNENGNESDKLTQNNESLLGLANMRPVVEREERSLFGVGKLRPEFSQQQGSTPSNQPASVILNSDKDKKE